MLVKTTVTTEITKDESKRLKSILRELKEAYVTIGFHEDAGKYTKGNNPPSVVEVALWNEFGTISIPERSFFRAAIDQNESKINAWREEAITNILDKGWTVKKALQMIGFRVQVLIQNKIKSNVPPPNAPSTIASKQREGVSPKSGFKSGFEGRTGTLIDTGLMLRSVTYKVYVK